MIELLWNRGKKKDWACAKCGKLNHPDAEFCEYCGNPRAQPQPGLKEPSIMKCPVCNKPCIPGAMFCGACGTQLKKADSTSPVQEIIPIATPKGERVPCVHCGTMNKAGDRFCCHCSKEIRIDYNPIQPQSSVVTMRSISCPVCGAKCDPGVAFCNECGMRVNQNR